MSAEALPARRAVWIGIDVGLDGGISAIEEGAQPRIFPMPTDTIVNGTKKKPTKKRVVNGTKLCRLLRELQHGTTDIYAMVERPQLRPALRRDAASGELRVNQGIASQASFMQQYGLITGILIGLGIPYEDCHPAVWKANMFHGASNKTDARVLAASLFPEVANRFERVKDDGLAESILIAEYSRRRHSAPF
jgi:hypothetical protein